MEEQDAAIKRTRLQRRLQNIIAPHTSFGRLLERKDQASLRARLIELADEYNEGAPILLATYESIKDYPSSAADAGEPDRIAKHFAQRVLNHRCLELEATQCAALCLGVSSAQSSEEYTFYSGWEGRHVMRQIMKDSPVTLCANSDNETEEHETLDANSMGNDEDDAEETSDPDAPINLLVNSARST